MSNKKETLHYAEAILPWDKPWLFNLDPSSPDEINSALKALGNNLDKYIAGNLPPGYNYNCYLTSFQSTKDPSQILVFAYVTVTRVPEKKWNDLKERALGIIGGFNIGDATTGGTKPPPPPPPPPVQEILGGDTGPLDYPEQLFDKLDFASFAPIYDQFTIRNISDGPSGRAIMPVMSANI